MKKIKDFEEYFITESGEVFNNKGKKLKLQLNQDGYLVVNLRKGGKYFHKRVNRLVAEAFIPNPNNLPVVNHIDHVRDNNDVSNLEWVTVSDNKIKSVENSYMNGKNAATISEADAHKVCRLIEQNLRNKEIADIVGTTINVVTKIRSGQSWPEVSSNYNLVKRGKSISESTARWVCEKIAEGLSNKEIVESSTSETLTKTIVKSIRAKSSWTWLSDSYF